MNHTKERERETNLSLGGTIEIAAGGTRSTHVASADSDLLTKEDKKPQV